MFMEAIIFFSQPEDYVRTSCCPTFYVLLDAYYYDCDDSWFLVWKIAVGPAVTLLFGSSFSHLLLVALFE